MWDFDNSLLVKMGILHREGRQRCSKIISTHWSFQESICNIHSTEGAISDRESKTRADEAKFKDLCACLPQKVNISKFCFAAPHSPHLTLGPSEKMDYLSLFLEKNFVYQTAELYFITILQYSVIYLLKINNN